MKKSYALALAIAALTGTVRAQEAADSASEPVAAQSQSEQIDALKGKIDGVEESYLDTKSTVDKLSSIKVGGMIQARYEYALDTGVLDSKSMSLQNRFRIRRGRIKVGHESSLGDITAQIQYAEDGIKLIDMYGSFYDPWKFVKVRLGAQDIPFGYEIGYSSSSMELAERSLFEQSVFNGEKDVGAVFFLNYNEGIFEHVDLKLGVMNGSMNVVGLPIIGNTGNGASASEFDDGKAFLGRLGFKAPVKDANFEIDGGVSGYYATYLSQSDAVIDFSKQLSNTNAAYKSTGNLKGDLKKQIFGADLQTYFSLLPIGGTVLRGEFYMGNNVCIAGNKVYTPYSYGVNATKTDSVVNASGKKVAVVTAVSDAKAANTPYIKPMMGWYATLIQNLGDDFQLVGRFEQFDPNTEVSGDDIGKVANTSADDIAYTQISAGVNYFLSGNVKLTVEYDHKMNETSASLKNADPRKDYSGDINNDLLTLQLQYKF